MYQVALFGAANIDIQGFTFEPLIPKDSNPGIINVCPGGVSRNIAENLARMGVRTELVTAFGGGVNGSFLVDNCKKSGIGIEYSLVLPGEESSTYMAIMDTDGDMALALSDMRISDKITVSHIEKISSIFDNAGCIEIDPCLSEDVIEYLLDNYGSIPVFMDPVSTGKARKIKGKLKGIHTLKLNKVEAEYLSDVEIGTERDFREASEYFFSQGIKNLFITLGKDGVFYNNGLDSGFVVPASPARLLNATGAGDAFMAGVIYGFINNLKIRDSAEYATGASILTLMARSTVSEEISPEAIRHKIKEIL